MWCSDENKRLINIHDIQKARGACNFADRFLFLILDKMAPKQAAVVTV